MVGDMNMYAERGRVVRVFVISPRLTLWYSSCSKHDSVNYANFMQFRHPSSPFSISSKLCLYYRGIEEKTLIRS